MKFIGWTWRSTPEYFIPQVIRTHLSPGAPLLTGGTKDRRARNGVGATQPAQQAKEQQLGAYAP